MDLSGFQNWLSTAPLPIVALLLFVAMSMAAAAGVLARAWWLREAAKRPDAKEDVSGQESYVVSAVLALLGLLLGFTFSLAVDRFDARRVLVLQEANAIGTTYLRSQLLEEPHRARMSELLVRYTDNRLLLARTQPGEAGPLLATNDALVTDIWTAAKASFETIKGLDFSSTFIDGVNNLIDLGASRKAARQARVPPAVFVVLLIYLVTTAGVLGYVLSGVRGRATAAFLLALLTLSLLLIIDIDRPTLGSITESQGPMEDLQRTLATWPPLVFDR